MVNNRFVGVFNYCKGNIMVNRGWLMVNIMDRNASRLREIGKMKCKPSKFQLNAQLFLVSFLEATSFGEFVLAFEWSPGNSSNLRRPLPDPSRPFQALWVNICKHSWLTYHWPKSSRNEWTIMVMRHGLWSWGIPWWCWPTFGAAEKHPGGILRAGVSWDSTKL